MDGYSFITRVISQFIVGVCCIAYSSDYELEGTVQQTIYKSDGAAQMVVDAEFKIFVRDEKWLIQTIEHKQFAKGRQHLKREIGSTNGAEIFEMVTPLEPESQQTSAALKPAMSSRFNTGTVVSNAVPVGQLDGSVVGHLWLMFASANYLSELKTNLLTPVYEPAASAPGDPNLKYKADWELLVGQGSLPSKVTFFYDARILGDNKIPHAVYRATETTNVNGMTIPAGFLFERYAGGAEARVRKRATARVTAIRPNCFRDSLMPMLDRKTVVADRRLAQAAQPIRALTYQATSNAPLPTIAAAKKAHDRKATPPKRSPVVAAVIVTTLCLPLVAGAIYFWTRGRKVE